MTGRSADGNEVDEAATEGAGPSAVEGETPAGEEVDVDEARRDLSRQRFTEGVKAYEDGRYKDSIDLLLEADRAMHHAMFAYNIGLAYQAMGDYTSALRWLRSYLRELPRADDRAEVEASISKLEARLQRRGVQQVTVLSVPEGAMVLVDKRAVGVTPWTGELPPGRHAVTLQLRGYDDVEQSFTLEAHRSRDVTMTLTQGNATATPAVAGPASPPPTEDAPADAASHGISPWTWITFGAGAGVLGGALVFELLRSSAEADAREAAQVDYLDALDTAKRHQLTARILAGVGGALVLTGGVLLVVDLSAGSAPAQASFGCTHDGCAVTAGGTW